MTYRALFGCMQCSVDCACKALCTWRLYHLNSTDWNHLEINMLCTTRGHSVKVACMSQKIHKSNCLCRCMAQVADTAQLDHKWNGNTLSSSTSPRWTNQVGLDNLHNVLRYFESKDNDLLGPVWLGLCNWLGFQQQAKVKHTSVAQGFVSSVCPSSNRWLLCKSWIRCFSSSKLVSKDSLHPRCVPCAQGRGASS